jgi:Leucine-rich repeat (LRR) protein
MLHEKFSLEILYLGGNRLEEVPASLGRLKKLVALALSDNRLQVCGLWIYINKYQSLNI